MNIKLDLTYDEMDAVISALNSMVNSHDRKDKHSGIFADETIEHMRAAEVKIMEVFESLYREDDEQTAPDREPFKLKCSVQGCRRYIRGYLGAGAGGGAFYDTKGNYLADLRNQEYG